MFQMLIKYCRSIFGIWSLLYLDLESKHGLFISRPSAEQNVPCGHPAGSGSNVGDHSLLVILLRTARGSVFEPSQRKACNRWKTEPLVGWLFAPSRPTPKATESWRQGEVGRGEGHVDTWQNVLSACRRGEPAQPWAGTDTVKGCKNQREQKKKLLSSPFYFQVGFA